MAFEKRGLATPVIRYILERQRFKYSFNVVVKCSLIIDMASLENSGHKEA